MKLKLSLKTLLRTPFKTLLTLVLLTAASFSLFSRAAEYVVTTREFNKIAQSYKGIGTFERQSPNSGHIYDSLLLSDERVKDSIKSEGFNYGFSFGGVYDYYYEPLTKEDIETISNLPYVSRTSIRYMTAGISTDGYKRIYNRGNVYNNYNHTYKLVIEATVDSYDYNYWNPLSSDTEEFGIGLNLSNVKILAGDKDLNFYTPILNIYTYNYDIMELNEPIIKNDSVYFPQFNHDLVFRLKSSFINKRFVFVVRYQPGSSIFRGSPLVLADRAAQSQVDLLYPLESEPDNYIETEKFSDLKDYLTLVDNDINTFDMVYTDDMGAIMRFAEDAMGIIEGRAITKEDVEKKAEVCVISKDFQKANNLKIGDVMNFELGNTLHEQNSILGSIAVVKERMPTELTPVALEIVGVYNNQDVARTRETNLSWNYSENTIFLPLSLLPADKETIDNQKIRPGEFSFIIDEPTDIIPFTEEVDSFLAQTEMTMLFLDGGWPELENTFGVTGTLSIIAVLTLVIAVFIAIFFTVFLFIARKKKEYAIMRALGVTVKDSGKALYIPLAIISIISIIGGTIAALFYTQSTIEKSLLKMAELGYEVSSSIPIWLVLICIVGEFLVLTVFVVTELRKLGQNSPLALLQAGGEAVKGKKEKKKNVILQDTDFKKVDFVMPKLDNIKKRYTSIQQTMRYIFIRTQRMMSKSLLSLILAVLIFGAISQFAALRYYYTDLYETFRITGVFTRGTVLSRAMRMEESGLVTDPYYGYINTYGLVNDFSATFYMTTDIARYTNSTGELKYSDGLDLNKFKRGSANCIIGVNLMEKLGLNIGDTVQLMDLNYKNQLINDFPSYDEDRLELIFKNFSAFYTVIGTLEFENDQFNDAIYLPISDLLNITHGRDNEIWLSAAEFPLNDNNLATEFRELGEKISGSSQWRKSFLMDTKELDGISNNMRLFNTLFPIVSVVLIVIGSLLPGLMIISSAKEACIFRILGTTKLRTRIIFIFQQMILSILGLIIGFGIVWLYNGAEFMMNIYETIFTCALIYFIACIFITSFCAANITKHKVLELLQTKE